MGDEHVRIYNPFQIFFSLLATPRTASHSPKEPWCPLDAVSRPQGSFLPLAILDQSLFVRRNIVVSVFHSLHNFLPESLGFPFFLVLDRSYERGSRFRLASVKEHFLLAGLGKEGLLDHRHREGRGKMQINMQNIPARR